MMSFFDKLFKNKRLSKDESNLPATKNNHSLFNDTLKVDKPDSDSTQNIVNATEKTTHSVASATSMPNPSPQTETDDKFVAVDDASDTMYKIKRELSDTQKQALEQSTLSLRASQLYMHYWQENLDNSNRDDPEWRNTVMFFWRAEEPFPKKSLPPFFQALPVRYFLFEKSLPNLSLTSMQAMPWFDQPGGGTKYVCIKEDKEVTVPELHDLGVIEYYEAVMLNDNLEILNDRDTYFFLINEQMIRFENGHFFLKDSNLVNSHHENKRMPLHVVYAIGAIHIVKKADV